MPEMVIVMYVVLIVLVWYPTVSRLRDRKKQREQEQQRRDREREEKREEEILKRSQEEALLEYMVHRVGPETKDEKRKRLSLEYRLECPIERYKRETEDMLANDRYRRGLAREKVKAKEQRQRDRARAKRERLKRRFEGTGATSSCDVYYLRVTLTDGTVLYKIGISKHTHRRVTDLGRTAVVKDIQLVARLLNGKPRATCETMEKGLHETYRRYKYNGPDVLTSGNTELFTRDVMGLDN